MVAFDSSLKNLFPIEKAISRSSHFYFVCLNLQGHYTYTNPYFEKVYITVGSPKQHFFDDQLQENDVELFQESFVSSIIEPHKTHTLSIRKKMVSGKWGTIYWEFSGIVNEIEDVIGVQCIGYEANEQMHLGLEMEQLRKANFKLSSVMQNTYDAHVFLDSNMHVLSFNQKAREKIRKTFGKELEIDSNFLNFNQDKVGFLESFSRAMEGETISQEHKVMYLSKEVAWFERRYYPVYNKQNQVIGVIFTSVDITKRKRAEQEIVRQNEQLKEIAALQSHLVRRPIVNLLGLLELLSKDELSEENNQLIRLLQQSILDLDGVIHGIVAKATENMHFGNLAANNDKEYVIGYQKQISLAS